MSLFQPTGTFMGLPATADLSGSRAAIVGIPYDMGVHPTRIGSRQGPDAIRAESSLVRRHLVESDLDPIAELGVVDRGNVRLTASRTAEAHHAIESAIAELVEADVTPVTMGGDGSVSLPQLRALGRRYPDLALLHFDAHTDAYAPLGEDRYTTGTTFYCAREERLLDAAASLHIGIRGHSAQAGVLPATREQGYEVLTIDDVFERGFDAVLEHIHRRLTGRQVYLCWDMDVFDPSAAPGVCTPSPGGFSAREGLYLLRRLAGLDFVAFDVNTVSPPHDVGGMTAMLAANVILECLVLACRRPR